MIKNKHTGLLLALLFGCATIAFFVVFVLPRIATGVSVTGYAWSDNIGWVSLSGSGYGLDINSDNTITGYAWGDNIGWVKFGGLSSFPTGSGTQALNAKVSGSSVVGWARACAGTADGTCAAMTSRTDGWDGWIALSGTGFGVSHVPGALGGYAWGSDVVGWLSFNATVSCAATTLTCIDSTHYGSYTDSSCTVFPGATCSTGQVCVNGSGCIGSAATGCLSVNSQTCSPEKTKASVRRGSAAELYWSTQNSTSCTVVGTNGQSWSGISGLQTTSAIQNQTTFTLSCDNGALVKKAVVNILPVYQEI